MRKQKQLLLDNEFEIEKEFGGAHLKKSHAKKPRPIAVKKTMHLTLRSSKAKGNRSFRYDKNRIQKINRVVRQLASRFGVEIHRFANVGNHLHLLVKASHRKGFISFLRSISGIIARIALGAERGRAKLNTSTKRNAMKSQTALAEAETDKATVYEAAIDKATKAKTTIGFWDQRPWTRVLYSWTDFKNVKKYVEQNFNEAMGFAPYKPRKYRSTA